MLFEISLISRGINGKRTEHQNGRGVPLEGHTQAHWRWPTYQNLQVGGLADKLRGTPGISLVLWWFCCVQFVSNNWGLRHNLVVNRSKFPSSEDTRPAADEWKHQFQFIFQYQWISARSMALVSMFLCNQSYTSHGWDFLLGAKILNFNAPFLVAHARMFKQPKPLWSIVNEHRFIFSSSSYMGSQVCSPSWSPFQLSSVRLLLPQK